MVKLKQWCVADSLDCDVDTALGGVEHDLMVIHDIMKSRNREDFANTAAIDEVGLITQDVDVVVSGVRQTALIAMLTSPSVAWSTLVTTS